MVFARVILILATMLLGISTTQSAARLPEAAVVAGTVREPDGAPVGGARVELRRPSPLGREITSLTVTNADGSFRIETVAPGEYYARVSRAGFVGAYYSKDQQPVDSPGDILDIAPAATIRLTFMLLRAGAISGRVIDPFGLPAVRAEVSAVAVRQRKGSSVFDEWVPSLPTDVDGSYRLGGLAPGEYRVVARLADMRSAPLGASDGPTRILRPTYHPAAITAEDAGVVSVKSAMETPGIDIAMHLHPSYRIKGQILGLPEGASVSMSITSADVAVSPVVTPTGAFDSLDELPAGRYQVIARITGRPPEPTLWAKAEVTVTGNIDGLFLPLQRTSTVTGLVVNAKGLPVPGVSVGLVPLESSFNLGGGVVATPSGKTSATGEFVIPDLFPGTYRVIVTSAGSAEKVETSLNGDLLANGRFEIRQSVSGLTIRIR